MDIRAVIVPGEAPESDDDTVGVSTGTKFAIAQERHASGTIISGEATESDDDGMSWSSASAAIDVTACPPYSDTQRSHSNKSFIKYNSLLHKKLHECNESLSRNVVRLSEGTISQGIQELMAVNRQLVKSESTVQESACQLRNASNQWRNASNALFQLIDANFLSSIKI
ncbi:uncharacterized protein [Venturia canescens]|uniref:uncharacterized protein n=1 Tax=Venturia canescens TaxID=32260 RepID=UPI001C9CE0F2|nr:uncharacterized protein LOC122413883 [Venturia canescens]XP_043280480.1 uncharacterized protein LOC122413883 [Venturia canescens]